MLRHSLVLVVLATLSGCGTLVRIIDPTERYTAYAGTAYDWQMAQQWGLPILDLPLSFLLDTALLPYAWSN